MGVNAARSLLQCALLLGFCSAALGCMCMETHPQQHLCTADFVLKMKVKSNFSLNRKIIRVYKNQNVTDIRPQWTVYKIKPIKAFKETPKFLKVDAPHLLYTSPSGASCGVALERGRKYVVSGSVIDGRLRINMCNWIKKWEETSRQQRKALVLGKYEKSCSCKVSTCYHKGCRRHKATDTCMWEKPGYRWRTGQVRYDLCLAELSYCRSSGGECQWSRSSAISQCYKRSILP